MATKKDTEKSLMIILSDDDDEDNSDVGSTSINEKLHDSTPAKNQETFVIVLSLLAKKLKDEKSLKQLCKLYNATPSHFILSHKFEKFLCNVCSKLRSSDSRENSFFLFAKVCRTLVIKEVQDFVDDKQTAEKDHHDNQQVHHLDFDIDSIENNITRDKNLRRQELLSNGQLSSQFSSYSTQTKPNVQRDNNNVETVAQSSICIHQINRSSSSSHSVNNKSVISDVGATTTKFIHAVAGGSGICNHEKNHKNLLNANKEETLRISENKLNSSSSISRTDHGCLDINPKVVLTYDPKKIDDIVKRLRKKSLLDKGSNSSEDSRFSCKVDNNEQSFDSWRNSTTEIGKEIRKTLITGTSSINLISTEPSHADKHPLPTKHSDMVGKTTAPFPSSKTVDDPISNPLVIIVDDDNDRNENSKELKTQLPESIHSAVDQSTTKKQPSKESKIRMLERKLKYMEKKITQYSEQELSLHDMESEDSVYMNEAKLKESYVRTWRLYCKITGSDPDELVATQKKIKVTSSPFPEINRAVAKYINRNGSFPNLFDIKQVCLQANDKYNLDLKQNDLHNCAVDVFTEVGQKLQKNREKEFREIGGNILTDKVKLNEDPALVDKNLKRRLKQNRKLAKKRTEEVFTDFVRQQYEQEAVGGSATSDSDDDGHLEKLRKNNLIANKKLKQQLINKNANVKQPTRRKRTNDMSADTPSKKKRNDKTVISVTVCSSKENNDDPITSQKVDYRVTIDSPIPSNNTGIVKPSFRSSPDSSTTVNKTSKNSGTTTTITDLAQQETSTNVTTTAASFEPIIKSSRTMTTTATTVKRDSIQLNQERINQIRGSKVILGMISNPTESAKYSSPLKIFRNFKEQHATAENIKSSTQTTLSNSITCGNINSNDDVILISDEED